MNDAVLFDRRANRRLLERGFVVVPLVPRTTARRLRDEYLSLREASPGEGFDADLNNPDVAYRTVVTSLVGRVLDDPVRALFVQHEPFLRNFLCKWPGDTEDLYTHRDWMFVDERSGWRTYSVWLALDDMRRSNGMLRVIPGSHRLARGLSGTDLDDGWTQHQEVMDRHLVDLPVGAGDAVVLDHGLVHASYRNSSGAPRVAVNCAVRPRGVALVHFRRLDERRAGRYDVEPRFFIERTPASLATEPPSAERAEVVEAPLPDVSAEQIDTLLRGLRRAPRLGQAFGRRRVRA